MAATPGTKSLVPTHLVDDTPEEEIKQAALEEAKKAPTAPQDDRTKKMQAEAYTFAFRHQAVNGTVYEGTFTSTIPDMATRQAIDGVQAGMCKGQPWETFTTAAQERMVIMSRLMFCLGNERPAWARDLKKIKDSAPLFALYGEVMAHEATFLGPRAA